MGSRYEIWYDSKGHSAGALMRQWIVSDNTLHREVCACWTEEDAQEVVDGLELLDEEYEV